MAIEQLTVTVDGKEIRLPRGTEVKHALNFAGGHRLIGEITAGRKIIWDERFDAQTDLGGALYDGQRLSIRDR